MTKWFELKKVWLLLREKSFATNVYEFTFSDYTCIRTEILKVVDRLFSNYYDENILYRSTWIIFSKFRSYKPFQLSIFDKVETERRDQLEVQSLINNINKKYNSHKVCYWTNLLNEWKWEKLSIMSKEK